MCFTSIKAYGKGKMKTKYLKTVKDLCKKKYKMHKENKKLCKFNDTAN